MQLTRVPSSLHVIVYCVLSFRLFHHKLFSRILRHISVSVYTLCLILPSVMGLTLCNGIKMISTY